MPIGDPVAPELIQQYQASGQWPTVSNLELLDRNAELCPDKEALVDARSRLTFRQFAEASKRLALAFHESGLKKGDVVVVQIPNCVEFMVMLICIHPKVLDVAVVAMPDRVMGEKACAFVIPKAGETISFEELIAFLRTQEIANYKLPERLELVGEFPMSAGGQKVQKNILREWITRKLEDEGKL